MSLEKGIRLYVNIGKKFIAYRLVLMGRATYQQLYRMSSQGVDCNKVLSLDFELVTHKAFNLSYSGISC